METHFFPRGKGPLVSILIPTRGRPEHLCQAIDSLCSLAVDVSLLEFILKIDDDDLATQEVATKIEQKVPIKKIISPRGNGYHDMHHWVNEMCSEASGDWLYLGNDDFRMKTQGWDHTVLNIGTDNPWPGINSCCLLYTPTQGRPYAQEFVMMRRETYNFLGHFSLSPHCDNWAYSIMNFMGCALTLAVFVEHLSDVIKDSTRRDSEEAYKTTQSSLTSVDSKKLKIQDISKIFVHLSKTENSIRWQDTPTPGWCWWRSSKGRESCLVSEDFKAYFFKEGFVEREVEVAKLGGQWCRRE